MIDLDGRIAAGALAPTSETGLHLGVHRRRGPGAVVHTHAPMATALSCVLDELPCVHYEMLALGGPVRVAPYATFGTPELAASVVEALEDRTAALMANHGAVTWGPDLEAALRATEVLEWGCARLLARGRDRNPAGPRRAPAARGRRDGGADRLRRHAPGAGRRRMSEMTAVAMGVHVLDVLVRPVEAIPEGQGGRSSTRSG